MQCAAQASTTIKRSEFGMTSWLDAVADEATTRLRAALAALTSTRN